MAVDKLSSPVTPNDLINKTNEIIDNLGSGGGGSSDPTTWYGTCSTTASTTEKAVTCSGFVLTTGAIIAVLFTTGNTAATPTLNVNTTGAKSIYIGASTPSSTTNAFKWSANTLLTFMYDGTYFRYMGAESAGSVIPSEGAGSWYGTSSSSATASAKTSSITNYILTQGARVSVTFTNANTYVAGALTLNINSTGAKTIYFNNAATSTTNTLTWEAGETITFIYSGSYYFFVSKSKENPLLSKLSIGSGTDQMYFDISSAGYPYVRWKVAGEEIYDQLVLRDTGLRRERQEDGTWSAVWSLENIGARVSQTASTAVEIPSGDPATTIASVELTAGVWILVGKIRFSANATGVRRGNIETTSGVTAINVQVQAVTNGTTDIQVTRIADVASSATYHLNAWQNSGSQLTCAAGIGYLTAVRIA